MARIAVDLDELRVLESGLGQFSYELSHGLLTHAAPCEEFTFFVPPRREKYFDHPQVTAKSLRRWKKAKHLRKVRRLAKYIPGPRYDVWHMTNQAARYAPWNPHVPVLLTIHDLNFLREKPSHTFPLHLRNLQRKVDRSMRVTTISNFVAAEIRQWLDLDGRSVDVIYNGIASAQQRDVQRPSGAPESPFLFSIGFFNEKKNFHALVEMMPFLPEFKLVIAGINDSNYGAYVRRCAVASGVADRLLLPGPISNDERAWYYRNCLAFVFPSLTEGFGLPPVEAMTAGKPVFLSTLTSLPEVGGKAAFYWEEFKPQYMASVVSNGLAQAHGDPSFAERVRRHASEFTWDRAARQYLAIYREMVAENNPRRKPTNSPYRLAG